jgi:unsaturated rhamnogalacturonyl hydrolase
VVFASIGHARLYGYIPGMWQINNKTIIHMDIKQKITDSNTPLHLLQPDYEVAYTIPDPRHIISSLDKILTYLERVTPAELVNSENKKIVSDYASVDTNTHFQTADFRLISYEWGVTYAGMLHATEVSGEKRFSDYAVKRLNFIESVRPYFQAIEETSAGFKSPVHSVIFPHALDDAGAMCAAMIKARGAEGAMDYGWMIRNYIDYISNKQYRFPDGTLARNYPQKNTLWIDDLFMSVPALAQMGNLTGTVDYFDDAVRQVFRFSERMFNRETGLFMHGWVMDMAEHPRFHWGRANGWALMAIVELLDKLPMLHPYRNGITEILNCQAKGLAGLQSGTGFWHQLLDRTDSYLETSATAIFAYSIARAINQGFLGAKEYGPMAIVAWNAVSSKINDAGQVEGTCVGTGMGFDPAFYYHRPVNPFAAHGYGPALLAGSEIIRLIDNFRIDIVENAFQFYEKQPGDQNK